MNKLIEIPFDANLIGKEGIVVKYRSGEEPYKVMREKGWRYIVVVSNNGSVCRFYTDGKLSTTGESQLDLIMYKEQKVMNVEEWIKDKFQCYPSQHYMTLTWKDGAKSLAAAIQRGEVDVKL